MAKIVACGTCRVPLVHAARPGRQDVVTCAHCGASDAFETIMREASGLLHERITTAKSSTLRDFGPWLAWLGRAATPAAPRPSRYVMMDEARRTAP